MGKVKLLMVTTLLFMTIGSTRAAWRVVIDPWVTAQVEANTSAQSLIEYKHNKKLDSIHTKQNIIKRYSTTMATVKELYKLSMQNVSGFGEESKMYKEIFNTTVDIFKDIPIAMRALNKFPGKNHLLCLNEISNLVTETEQCAALFKSLVANGKVKSPIAKNKYSNGDYNSIKDDDYNFMDRWTRWSLANSLLTSLTDIRYRLEAIAFMCQYCNTMSNLMFNIDVDSWLAYFTAKNTAEGLISDWKGLGS